jgi:hypothetical protein
VRADSSLSIGPSVSTRTSSTAGMDSKGSYRQTAYLAFGSSCTCIWLVPCSLIMSVSCCHAMQLSCTNSSSADSSAVGSQHLVSSFECSHSAKNNM